MRYPSLQMVEQASRVQLARWYRFLPSPGFNHLDTPDFSVSFRAEMIVLDRIVERLAEVGGMTPELSRNVGLVN